MLLDTLNLNTNSLVELILEFYASCFPISNFNSTDPANGVFALHEDISNSEMSKIHLEIPFAVTDHIWKVYQELVVMLLGS
ncbi:MAG: hypothetical protein Ta2E_00970 [Mycoplasmoidaceae bacterium]|nr:MAG: hypothetical protein Ta2E_00970 [Mycoplasmoidaceae bacterium]